MSMYMTLLWNSILIKLSYVQKKKFVELEFMELEFNTYSYV